MTQPEDDSPFLAVTGLAGRFPGAADPQRFWQNLVAGVESITRGPAGANGLVDGADEFDARFFRCSPNEALLLDPQHRLFLECSWSALEDAGHDPAEFPGAIGIYGGSSETEYAAALRAHTARREVTNGWQQLRLGTCLDFLTTRVAYKLGLRGPAVTVQTACSTSLVAVHVAAQALLAGECDMALAGGVTVHLWPKQDEDRDGGYLAPDGRCRTFDAGARGTVFSNGAGVVVLRRLADAIADGDNIRAVIRGSAVNNDGFDKIGFTAPSLAGQAEAVEAALLAAAVPPETVSYLEAHGTGTPIGDPIEVAALTRAFRRGTDRTQFCRIGSVKTNIGHTDAASGVAGLIKTVLALEHRLIPPSLHFRDPNPQIDFQHSPFVVNTDAHAWETGTGPRRAGVSSFGIGGTNAHVVLEEAPTAPAAGPARPWQLLVLSALDGTALDAATGRLAADLRAYPDRALADIAWTLQAGRRHQPHRRFAVCGDGTEAAAALERALPGPAAAAAPPVAFLFPGQGGQYVGMGRELYEHEPEFRARIDECSELLAPELGLDLRSVLYPPPDGAAAAAGQLEHLDVGQPAVFAVEFALARLWAHWGVTPAVVAGHSLGAYAAACVAGVLSLPDALHLLAVRGRLLETLPPGAMLAVPLPEAELGPLLPGGVTVAAVNGPGQCVAAGPSAPVHELRARLAGAGLDTTLLPIPAGGHCGHVDPIVEAFERAVGTVSLRAPAVPMISDTTGAPLSAQEVTTPAYWARHLRRTVRFGDVLTRLLDNPDRVLVEVGPGRTLTGLARKHPAWASGALAVHCLPHPTEPTSDLLTLLTAAGRLWQRGTEIRWPALHDGQRRQRVPLPTYPFQRRRYTVDPPAQPAGTAAPPRIEQLPPPDADRTDLGTPAPAVVPGTPTEQFLIKTFEYLLGGQVEPQDNFFDLGGDSLIANQLLRLVSDGLGSAIPLRAVFQARTITELAARIDEAAGS